MKRKKWCTLCICILLCSLLLLSGCKKMTSSILKAVKGESEPGVTIIQVAGTDNLPDDNSPENNNPIEPDTEASTEASLDYYQEFEIHEIMDNTMSDTEPIATISLPVGWDVQTYVVDESYISLFAHDMANPDIQLFFMSTIGPFYQSQEAKDYYHQIYPVDTYFIHYFPVSSIEDVASKMDECEELCLATNGIYIDFPDINNLVLTNKTQGFYPLKNSVKLVDDSVIAFQCTAKSGAPCNGCVSCCLVDGTGVIMNGMDIMPSRIGYSYMGVIVPEDLPEDVTPALISCLGSMTFSEKFVKRSVDSLNELLDANLEFGQAYDALHTVLTEYFLTTINGY